MVERLADRSKEPLPSLPTATSVHLEPSGVAVMRSGWEREAAYLFLNYGTHDSFHTHRATLDFELYAHGAPLALDAGIGLTYDDPLYLTWYVTARAHNMVVVDDVNADRATARGRDVLWHSDPRVDVFAATHAGYAKSRGITHRRAIAFLKPDAFVVFDTCSAEADGHTLSWYFHSPTDLVVQPGSRVVSAAGPGVLLAAASPEQLTAVRHGKGMCSLAELGGYREIDWIALDKPANRGDDNRFVVLDAALRQSGAGGRVHRRAESAWHRVRFPATRRPHRHSDLRQWQATDAFGWAVGHRWLLCLGTLPKWSAAREDRGRRHVDLGGSIRAAAGERREQRR